MEQAKVAVAFKRASGKGGEKIRWESTRLRAAFVPGAKGTGIADPRRVSRNHPQRLSGLSAA